MKRITDSLRDLIGWVRAATRSSGRRLWTVRRNSRTARSRKTPYPLSIWRGMTKPREEENSITNPNSQKEVHPLGNTVYRKSRSLLVLRFFFTFIYAGHM